NVTAILLDTSLFGNDCQWNLYYTYQIVDACGNVNTGQKIEIQGNDITPPTFTVPDSVTLECNQNINDLAITGDVTDELDNCAQNLEAAYTDSVVQGNCPNESIVTRIWPLTDACGNSTEQTQIITVQDTTVPVIDTAPQNIVIECEGSGNNDAILLWLNSHGGATASDNCSPEILWTNDYNGALSDCAAPVIVTFTATDACGNSVSATATYSIQDTVPPVITGGDDMTVECDGTGNLDDLNNWLTSNAGADATDDCSAITWSNNYSSLSDGCGE